MLNISERYYNTGKSVNEKLLCGYEGNTVFHHAVCFHSFKCREYLLTTNFDYSNVNKDFNGEIITTACLRGNYDATFRIIETRSKCCMSK